MKLFLQILMLISITHSANAQCFERLSEAQDTTSSAYAIGTDGQLYTIDAWNPNNLPSLIYPGVMDWHRVFTSDGWSSNNLALKNDSTLWEFGALTNLTQVGNAKWKDISFLWGLSCGVQSNGTLWRWGGGLVGINQIGLSNDWKDIEVLNYWYNNWNVAKLLATKNNGSLWLYDFSAPIPQWVQLGNGMQWDFIKGVNNAGTYSISLYAINNIGDLYRWENTVNTPVLVGNGPWKEIACVGNLEGIMGLKLDGSTHTWTSYDTNPITPVQLPNNSPIDDIDLILPGVYGLSSSSLLLFANDYVNNSFYPSVGIGIPCCNVQNTVNMTECDFLNWNGQYLDTSGTYITQLTNINGCDSLITLNLTITSSPIEPIISVQNNVELVTGIQQGATFQWINCENGLPLVGDTLNSFQVNVGGFYAVIVNNQCGTDTSECVFVSNLNLQEYMNEFIYLSPNPTTGEFKMNVPEEFIGSNFQIVDEMGKCIFSDFIQSTSDSFSISTNQKAIYFLYIDNCPIVTKLVKN